MDKNTVLYVIAALLLGFIGGFLLANSMNRSEMSALRAQAVQPATANTTSAPATRSGDAEPSLTDDEIKEKVAEADRNPANFDFQKNLGTALYKYSAMKDLPGLLPDTLRILDRADSLNNKDFDVIIALGNAHFDLAFQNKDAVEFQKARDAYTRALAIKPADPDVQTDSAITWYVQPSPDYSKAATALEKVVAANPKQTRAMEFLAQSYIKLGRSDDAQKVIEKIKSVDPSSSSIPELTKQLAAAQAK
jgi:tetratricopeptide (TPR) repeat protein